MGRMKDNVGRTRVPEVETGPSEKVINGPPVEAGMGKEKEVHEKEIGDEWTKREKKRSTIQELRGNHKT